MAACLGDGQNHAGWIDPEIKLIACGSSGAEMPTYPEWDRIVLEQLYDHVDYISMHRYYWQQDDLHGFLRFSTRTWMISSKQSGRPVIM